MTTVFKFNTLSASAVLCSGLLFTPLASASDNPFHMPELSSGNVVADGHGGKKNKFKKMDTDESGSVSKDEFMAYMEKKFERKDKNGDGELTRDEMKCKKKHGKDKG